MRKAQDKLLGDVDRSAGNVDNSVETSSAATAFKDDRLTFVWLDGEVQKVDCFIISNFTIYLLLSSHLRDWILSSLECYFLLVGRCRLIC